MPRDSDKNNDSRGRRDRPGDGKSRAGSGKGGGKGRSGAARGPEKKFAKRGFAGKGDGDGERRPYAGKSEGAKSFGKKPYAGAGKPYAGKRDGDDRPPRRDFGDAPRPRGDRPFTRDRNRDSGIATATQVIGQTVDRVRIFARAMLVAARSVRSSRAATVRILIATTVRRAVIATMHAPLDVFPTGNLATRSRILRAKVAARSDPIRRVAKVFAKTMTVRVAIGPLAPGRRAMAIVPVVIDLKENLAVTRSFRAVRPIEARARILAPDRGDSKPWQKREERGERDSRPARDGARNFDKPRFDRSRDDRGGEERPRFSRSREDRPTGDRPKFDRPRRGIAIATLDGPKAEPTGRSILAAKRVTTGRAARTRMTARSSPSVRRSAAVVLTVSAKPNSKSAGRSRPRSRNPASASQKWWPAPALPRAAIPRS